MAKISEEEDRALRESLVKDYQGFFGQYGGDPAKTCMAWGFQCGPGWLPIIRAVCVAVDALYKTHELNNRIIPYEALKDRGYPTLREKRKAFLAINAGRGRDKWEPFQFTQIKEKYGTLRLDYVPYDGYKGALAGIEAMAEAMSARTCERCGSTSSVMRSTECWMYVRCKECIAEELKDGDYGWKPV
jgi:hypothetical protein